MRIDKTRTAQEQKVANLLRLLGFNLKTDYRPSGREFDVFAVLGPLRVAVECKDYAEGGAGGGNIEEFSKKMRGVGNLLGVFVANRFSEAELEMCKKLGIAHWTTPEVENTLETLRAEEGRYKHIPLRIDVWSLLSALKTYTNLWYEYIEDWAVQREVRDTPLFEHYDLIEVDRKGGQFSYTKTEIGEMFFDQFRRIKILLSGDEVSQWEDSCEAASILEKACSWDNITAPGGLGDRMIITSLGIHRIDDFQLTPFGERLKVIMAQIRLSERGESRL